jgi:hypothetical protein
MRAALLFSALISPRLVSCLEVNVGVKGNTGMPVPQCLSLTNEALGVECLRNPAIEFNEDSMRVLLEGSLLRGWFNAAEVIIDVSQEHNFDVSTALHQTSGKIRARLVELAERLASTAVAVAIPPAIEWAQSPTLVFVNVKWALKLSNPATLGCVPVEPNFTSSSVDFRAACDVKRKTFALAATLWGNITPALCTWTESSVGRASLTLWKKEEGPWPRLLAQKTIRVPVWWSMHENHEAANEAWHSKTPTPAPTLEPTTLSASPTPTLEPTTLSASPTPTLTPSSDVGSVIVCNGNCMGGGGKVGLIVPAVCDQKCMGLDGLTPITVCNGGNCMGGGGNDGLTVPTVCDQKCMSGGGKIIQT